MKSQCVCVVKCHFLAFKSRENLLFSVVILDHVSPASPLVIFAATFIFTGEVWPRNPFAETEAWSSHIKPEWPFVSDLCYLCQHTQNVVT